MSGTACACNDQTETTFFSGTSVGNEAERGAVGADDTNFCWNPRLAKKGVGGLEGRPVGPATHNNSDKGARAFQELDGSEGQDGFEELCKGLRGKRFKNY
jgi:hypothetical protein